MKTINQAAVVAAILLASSGVAAAQGHASHYGGSRAATRQSSSGAHTGTHGSTSNRTGTTSSNDIVLNGDSGLTLQELLNPVPGLGFDYAHLAAINSNLGVQALIDPLTRMRLAQAERLLRESPAVTPVFFGGFGDSGSQPIEIQQPQPQIIVIQQPAPQSAPEVEGAPAPEPMAAVAPAESRPGADQFILVLRDGSQITAVAFSRQDSRIVYITPEGSRRWLAISGLDAAATVRVNEERGTSLQLPI
jgi:hypothetical protein